MVIYRFSSGFPLRNAKNMEISWIFIFFIYFAIAPVSILVQIWLKFQRKCLQSLKFLKSHWFTINRWRSLKWAVIEIIRHSEWSLHNFPIWLEWECDFYALDDIQQGNTIIFIVLPIFHFTMKPSSTLEIRFRLNRNAEENSNKPKLQAELFVKIRAVFECS